MIGEQKKQVDQQPAVVQLTAVQWELVRRYVGLARRAGELLIGLEQIKRSRQTLLAVTADADPLPARVFLQLVPDSPAEPGQTIGRKNVKVVALPDGRMARHIEQLITKRD